MVESIKVGKHLPDSLASFDARGVAKPPKGMPHIRVGASPHRIANKWLNSLLGDGCHSPKTWTAYAQDLAGWLRYLQANGADLLDDPKSVLAPLMASYRSLRLNGDPSGQFSTLTSSSWTRTLTGITKFYDWANEENLVSGHPTKFAHKSVRIRNGGVAQVRVNKASARTGAKGHSIKSLTPDYVSFFIEAGLRGIQPDTGDVLGKIQNTARNAALGELLFASGLRINEARCLTTWEIPALPKYSDFGRLSLRVPAKVAKRGKGRETWISANALKHLHNYIEGERALLADPLFKNTPRALIVTAIRPEGVVANGRYRRFSALSEDERLRLVAPDGTSPILFLSSRGTPLAQESISNVFNRASIRCQAIDPNFPHVTPHMLRHAFAVNTLIELTAQQFAAYKKVASTNLDPREVVALTSGTPLLAVRDLLGHESLQTTQIYIDHIDPVAVITAAEAIVEDEDDA